MGELSWIAKILAQFEDPVYIVLVLIYFFFIYIIIRVFNMIDKKEDNNLKMVDEIHKQSTALERLSTLMDILVKGRVPRGRGRDD